MGRFFRKSDRDVDRLLAGKAPGGDEDLAELAAFLRQVEACHTEAPSGPAQARQLAAIVEEAQLPSDNGEPAARPASKATGSRDQTSGLPKWRRKLVLNGIFSTLWTRVAAVAVLAGLLSGGLASAGALPDPLQAAVADAASEVGVSLQDPNANAPAGVDATDDGDANKPARDDTKQKDNDAKQNDKPKSDDDGDSGNAAPAESGSGTGNVETTQPPNDVQAFQQPENDANEPEDNDASEPEDNDAEEPEEDDEGEEAEDEAEDEDESGDVDSNDEEDSDEGGEDD